MKRALVVLISVAVVCPCAGRILIVDDDGPADFDRIQPAVDDANDGDVIVLFPGRYTGFGNTDIEFAGKAITLRSVAPTDDYIVAATVIDCNASQADPHRAFSFQWNDGPDSLVDGLTITGGYQDLGGAIFCDYGGPTIANCRITDNSAADGAGIYCFWAYLTFRNCLIERNSASGSGGGIHFTKQSIATVEGCTITENTAEIGGAVHCAQNSTVTFTGCTITGNSADLGGAMYCTEESVATVEGCTITGNSADVGGGIYFTRDCIATVEGCTITANSAERGGAMYDYMSSVSLITCTFEGNRANQGGGLFCYHSDTIPESCIFVGNRAQDGGAMFLSSWDGNVINCTLAGNRADGDGAAIYADLYSGPHLTNCILWANTDADTAHNVQIAATGEAIVEFSCIQDNDPDDANIPYGLALPGAPANNGNIDDDPLFIRLPDDGGDGWGDDPQTPDVDESLNDDFGDIHLQIASPCINTGIHQYAPPSAVDIDGRPRIIGPRVDMGAHEYAPMIAVTKPSGGELWAAGSSHEIRWSSWAYAGLVDILLSTDAGQSWDSLLAGAPDSGALVLELPEAVDSNRCIIAVIPGEANPDVLTIESGTFTVHPDTLGPHVDVVWPSLAGDFDRSGLSNNSGPQLGCIKWKFELGGAVPTSVTIGAEGRMHIACEDGRLYTLDPNGSPLWIFDANSPLISSPSVGPDGSLYVGAEDGRLYVVDPNGNLRWTCATGHAVYSSPAVSPDGAVYLGSQDGRLYALAADGSEKWSFATKGPGLVLEGAILASPAIGPDGTVYIGGLYDPNLYALDPNDGSIKWVCNFEYPLDPADPNSETEGGWPFAAPVVAPDGTIYQTLLYDSNLYAIDPNDGNILWSTNLDLRCEFVGDYISQYQQMPPPYMIEQYCDRWYGPGPHAFDRYEAPDGWSEPALAPDGTIYVSFDDPYLRAVEPNGAIKWVTRLGVMGGFTLTVANNGLIYAASDDGALCIVDPAGAEIARFTDTAWLNYPVLAPDNTLIVSDGRDYSVMSADANNVVYAISLEACETEPLALRRPADIDGDGRINFIDFALLIAQWAACTDTEPYSLIGYASLCDYEGDAIYLAEDIDRDLYAFISDLIIMADRWLDAEPETTGPESPLGPNRPPPGWPNPDWYQPGSGGGIHPPPPPKTRTCFPGETPVWIDGSLTKISSVAAGRNVGKSDCLAIPGALQAIERVDRHEGSFECRDIVLESGERISVVDSHCFMLESGRWAAVQDIKAGSKLKSMTGSVAVKSIAKRQTSLAGRVYNLKIEGSDRYFVGRAGLIVRDY